MKRLGMYISIRYETRVSSDVHNVHSQVLYLLSCESVFSQGKRNVYDP